MALTQDERKARREAGRRLAITKLTIAESIHRELVSGRPPQSELRTPAEAVSAARVLYGEVRSRMVARGLDPKPGDFAVKIAYVSSDLSMMFSESYSPGREADVLTKLTGQPIIVLGLLFGIKDNESKDDRNVVTGIKPFLVTRLTVAWMTELANHSQDELNAS